MPASTRRTIGPGRRRHPAISPRRRAPQPQMRAEHDGGDNQRRCARGRRAARTRIGEHGGRGHRDDGQRGKSVDAPDRRRLRDRLARRPDHARQVPRQAANAEQRAAEPLGEHEGDGEDDQARRPCAPVAEDRGRRSPPAWPARMPGQRDQRHPDEDQIARPGSRGTPTRSSACRRDSRQSRTPRRARRRPGAGFGVRRARIERSRSGRTAPSAKAGQMWKGGKARLAMAPSAAQNASARQPCRPATHR